MQSTPEKNLGSFHDSTEFRFSNRRVGQGSIRKRGESTIGCQNHSFGAKQSDCAPYSFHNTVSRLDFTELLIDYTDADAECFGKRA